MPVELGVEGVGRDPVTEDDPPDRRLGAQEQDGPAAVGGQPSGQPVFDRVDDAVHLADAELLDVRSGVEALAFRAEVADRARSGRGR